MKVVEFSPDLAGQESAGTHMGIVLKFSAFEVEAVKSWHDYASSRSLLLNVKDLLLPPEKELIRKLEAHVNKKATFSKTEIEIMCDWMERAVRGKYGSVEELMGYELRACKLLKMDEMALHRSCVS